MNKWLDRDHGGRHEHDCADSLRPRRPACEEPPYEDGHSAAEHADQDSVQRSFGNDRRKGESNEPQERDSDDAGPETERSRRRGRDRDGGFIREIPAGTRFVSGVAPDNFNSEVSSRSRAASRPMVRPTRSASLAADAPHHSSRAL